MSDIVKVAIIAALGTVMSGCFSTLIILLIKRLEVKIDGRLSQLLDQTKKAAHAEGHIEGVADEKKNGGKS